MANQKGAALVVVLSLLMGSLVVGLSSMQSSLVDERLAGNFRISSNLSMAAEEAGASAFSIVRSDLAEFLNDSSCSSDDFFLPIDSGGNLVAFDSDAEIDSGTPLPVERDDLDLDWQTFLSINTFESLESGPCANVLTLADDFADGDCSDGGSSVVVECAFRYLTFYDDSEEDGERVSRFIVAMARMIDDEANEIGMSLPLFIEVEYADIDINWLFKGPPITFLADFDTSEVSVNGANNMTLNGGDGVEVSVPPGTASAETTDFFVDQFTNKHGVPEVSTNGMAIEEFVGFIEELRKAAVEFDVPGIHYVTEDPVMSDYDGGVLVVADNFTWNGNNDFHGVIIVLGAKVAYNGGGSGNLYGSMIHAPITPVNPDYAWINDEGFVEFPDVDRYSMSDGDGWVFGNANFDFDFNGGGSSVLENDADALESSAGNAESAPGFAKATSWETN